MPPARLIKMESQCLDLALGHQRESILAALSISNQPLAPLEVQILHAQP